MPESQRLRGWSAYHAHRKQDEADRQAIVNGLVSDLHREPTTADRLAIEQIAALTTHARRLERRGQFDRAAVIRDQIARSARAFGIKAQPPAPAKPAISPLEYARTRYSEPAVAADPPPDHGEAAR